MLQFQLTKFEQKQTFALSSNKMIIGKLRQWERG